MGAKSLVEKALSINKDASKYGSFAEIGAGQEVAKHFFDAGWSSQTVAKSMSAYDMKFSDAIYGKAGRYVSRERLESMLNHEYNLLHERLGEKRGKETRFFAFADTVATASFKKGRIAHGWLGIRFQLRPLGPANEIILHTILHNRMPDRQREALGKLGVNLVHAALNLHNEPEVLIEALTDYIDPGRVVIDMIEFRGDEFTHIDNRLMNLRLVEMGFSPATIFEPTGGALQIMDTLYAKSPLVLRGSFCPLTKIHVDMLESAKEIFNKETENVLPMLEMTIHHLREKGQLYRKNFLDRVDTLTSLGYPVMISDFFLFSDLKNYLQRFTENPIALILGAGLLDNLFTSEYYKDYPGGFYEGMGKLFHKGGRMYVYPHRYDKGCLELSNYQAKENNDFVQHLKKDNKLQDLKGKIDSCTDLEYQNILEMIRKGQEEWKDLVPEPVVKIILERKLFGSN